MVGYTHLTTGIMTAVIMGMDIVGGILLCVGSILPDVDSNSSLLGRSMPFIGRIFGHRGFFHSLLFCILCVLVNRWLGIGVAVHMIGDTLTDRGVRWFYPFKYNVRLFGIKTGGLLEKIIFVMSWLIIVGVVIYKIVVLKD